MKLLITDDQNSVHLFLDRMIPYEKMGICQVFHARNGEEALAIIKKELPELLLLDICMPVMDGLALLEAMELLSYEHRVMILSAYNEFEYAKKCMRYGVRDYLLKPIDAKEVMKSLEKHIREILEIQNRRLQKTFERYLKGQADGTEYIPEELGRAGYGIVCCESGNVPCFAQEADAGEKGTTGKLIGAGTTEEVAVWVYEASGKEEWRTFYERQKEQNKDIRIGFGNYHCQREEFEQAFMESLEALRQGFYQPGTYFYEKGSLTRYQGTEAEKLSGQLKKSFETGNVQEMKQAVEKLFFIFRRGNVHPVYVQDFCYGFLIQLNPDFVETLKKLRNSSVEESLGVMDAAGVKNAFLRLMLSMRLELPPEEVQTDEDVVRKIRHYIDTNYEKDISLTNLSQHFFISKYQISRLFKKQFGVNYSDYILKVRMEAAAMMLTNSKEKIDEIAQRAGFEETSYFSRVFSKYYGMAPGEYRKKNGRD